MIDLAELSLAVEKGKRKLVTEYIQQALDEGMDAQVILNQGLLPGMDRIGQKFRDNEVFVPEVLVAARAMNTGTTMLKPILASNGTDSSLGTMVLGTVKGDMHDIGKNLVRMMIESKGINVIDLGVDVAPEAFVEAVKEHNASLVGCSALLTTTMPVMADVVRALEEAGVRDKVTVMIGGAPVNDEYCKKIGADVCTPDAASAAMKAKEILEAKRAEA